MQSVDPELPSESVRSMECQDRFAEHRSAGDRLAESAECALAAAEHLEICIRRLSDQIEQVRVTYSTANLALLVDPAYDPFSASQAAKQDLKNVHQLLLSADGIARDAARATPDMWEATVIVRSAIARVVLAADTITGYLTLAGSMLRVMSRPEKCLQDKGDPSLRD